MKMFRVIVRGKFPPGLNCLGDISVANRDFSVEMEPDFLELFNKRSEKKQVSSIEIKKKHCNMKRTEIIMYMRGSPPPQRLALHAKVRILSQFFKNDS